MTTLQNKSFTFSRRTHKEPPALSVKVKKQLEIIDFLKDNKEVLKSSIRSKSSLGKLIEKGIVLEYYKETYISQEFCSE